MKMFMFCILLVSVEYIFAQGLCQDKSVITKGKYDDVKKITPYTLTEIEKFYSDYHKSYHGDSSCTTLLPKTTGNDMCCYLKIKYKNLISDEKYTHYGCIEQNSTLIENDGIDGIIDEIEEGFIYGMKQEMNYRENRDINNYVDYVDKVKIHIDCSSKFLKFIAITLLSFLL